MNYTIVIFLFLENIINKNKIKDLFKYNSENLINQFNNKELIETINYNHKSIIKENNEIKHSILKLKDEIVKIQL